MTRTINITPTFEESARLIAVILEEGDHKGKEWAREELARWGRMLDEVRSRAENPG